METKEKGAALRVATVGDAEKILEIYAPYIEKTAITFEYEIPEIGQFRGRIRSTLEKYPYLVAERDGEILGYAYTGAFKGRAAYAWTAETSIYIREGQKKQGLGRKLSHALENISKAQGILNLVAYIAFPEQEDAYLTRNSAEFHAHLGFARAGEYHKCGYKFGRWYNLVCMEKLLGEHDETPAPFVTFPELCAKMDISELLEG